MPLPEPANSHTLHKHGSAGRRSCRSNCGSSASWKLLHKVLCIVQSRQAYTCQEERAVERVLNRISSIKGQMRLSGAMVTAYTAVKHTSCVSRLSYLFSLHLQSSRVPTLPRRPIVAFSPCHKHDTIKIFKLEMKREEDRLEGCCRTSFMISRIHSARSQ